MHQISFKPKIIQLGFNRVTVMFKIENIYQHHSNLLKLEHDEDEFKQD